ncbi:Serine/threonine-protein kinase pim-2 [Labeo rohita]|uniref:non-specific serine/threonine protein kinase n=1 Tax=Labeo rohita TaxID=84645 RepID=A0ABQ8M5U7_LABRO|nr:Serine/threonine-protein kinase pim-2 [Labeo rohita]
MNSGGRLGVGGFGVVHEAIRVEDGLKVAVKEVLKTHDLEYLTIPDHPNPLPMEIALTILANKGPTAPGIIKMLDWQDQRDNYVMVLECPSPCENLVSFLEGHGCRLSEGLVRHIMRQATQAARTCCRRGVFHGDMKLENFIVSKNTLEVKLIDFGCGDLMRKSAYTTLYGTMEYYPPEYRNKGKYHAKPAMSWSLGVILFTMLCGRFPTGEDLQKTELNLWSEPGLSEAFCSLNQNGGLVWEKSFAMTGLRSPCKSWRNGDPTPDISKVSCQLCVLRAGRKAFHPSGNLCVLRGRQAMFFSGPGLSKECCRFSHPHPPSGSSFWGISLTTTGFRSPYVVENLQPQTFPVSPVSFASCWLAGRPPIPPGNLCVLRVRQAMVASCAMA